MADPSAIQKDWFANSAIQPIFNWLTQNTSLAQKGHPQSDRSIPRARVLIIYERNILVSEERVMLGNNIPTYLRQNYDKFCQTLLILLGILSLTWPLGANPASLVKEKPNTLYVSPTAISFNWLELLKNAIRYVQVSNISEQEEVEIGKQINQKLLTQQYKLHNSSQIQKYADKIGQELVASSNSRNIPYTFQVVMGEEVNAFATPGGFVYLTTGLLKEADNQAQLASAIAHEIAHINQKHHLKALKQAVLAQGIAETAGINTNTLAQIGYQLAIELPQSREDEYEASHWFRNFTCR